VVPWPNPLIGVRPAAAGEGREYSDYIAQEVIYLVDAVNPRHQAGA